MPLTFPIRAPPRKPLQLVLIADGLFFIKFPDLQHFAINQRNATLRCNKERQSALLEQSPSSSERSRSIASSACCNIASNVAQNVLHAINLSDRAESRIDRPRLTTGDDLLFKASECTDQACGD